MRLTAQKYVIFLNQQAMVKKLPLHHPLPARINAVAEALPCLGQGNVGDDGTLVGLGGIGTDEDLVADDALGVGVGQFPIENVAIIARRKGAVLPDDGANAVIDCQSNQHACTAESVFAQHEKNLAREKANNSDIFFSISPSSSTKSGSNNSPKR